MTGIELFVDGGSARGGQLVPRSRGADGDAVLGNDRARANVEGMNIRETNFSWSTPTPPPSRASRSTGWTSSVIC
jgi:hypothetical protein